MGRPARLYHGSHIRIDGPLVPILTKSADHLNTEPSLFATERADIAALFMLDPSILSSIGFEEDIAYVCIWGAPEEVRLRDIGGYLYVLPGESFIKIGKEYEWQAAKPVMPEETLAYPSAIEGMIEHGVQVYFIRDEKIMDRIVADKTHRAPILHTLVSENQKLSKNVRSYRA